MSTLKKLNILTLAIHRKFTFIFYYTLYKINICNTYLIYYINVFMKFKILKHLEGLIREYLHNVGLRRTFRSKKIISSIKEFKTDQSSYIQNDKLVCIWRKHFLLQKLMSLVFREDICDACTDKSQIYIRIA